MVIVGRIREFCCELSANRFGVGSLVEPVEVLCAFGRLGLAWAMDPARARPEPPTG